jgi:hypothetical protein
VVTPPPPPAPTPVPEDARLTLYRQALAAWESGGDPGPALAQVREIERVVTFGAAEAERTRKVLDRCHEQAVRRLIELYDLAPLTDDPRRYRPRGLLGLGRKAEHDLRSLPGLTEALAACARDLAVYAEAAAAVVGVGILAQEAPRIRAVFGELIKLIAHWRAQLGDPPPISVTMSLDGGSGIVALPGVVAQDLEALARRKAKAGPAATVLAPLLEECVALYRASLTKAGATVPPRTVKKPREGALASVTRLAAELGELATCCQTAFAEVARQGFAPTPAQQALLDDNHLLRSALAALSEGAVALASGTSCPPAPNEGTIPTGDPAAQSAAITRLGSWYTTVLAYRIVQA